MKRKQSSLTVLFFSIVLFLFSQPSQAQVTGTITLTPNFTQTLTGTVTFTVKVNNAADTFSAIYITIDGGPMFDGLSNHASPFYTPVNPSQYSLDTTKYLNGSHQLYIAATNTLGGPDFGDYGPITFTIQNASVPYEMRAGYNELWLTPGQTATLSPEFVNTDNSITPFAATLATFSSAAPAIASASANGVVTAGSLGDTTITMSYPGLASSTIYVHVNAQNVTPHFGKGGVFLSAYNPTSSLFERSMFFLGPDQLTPGVGGYDPQYSSALKAAQVNSLETGFYLSPANYTSAAQWQSDFNNLASTISSVANSQNFNIMFTGDTIARGDAAVYTSSRGPSASWSPNPITYAFTWLKNMGRALGVEMVDEVSTSYSAPLPQGTLGASNGPQSISCVSNNCTVSWPLPYVMQNGAGTFLITGALSNANLNRPVTNLYRINSSFYVPNAGWGGFTFTATGIGSQTFTAATDPGLTIQILASHPDGPTGTDYVHNDAFQFIRSAITAVPNHTPIDWPAAGAAPVNNVYAWEGDPNIADYGIIYWPGGASNLSLMLPVFQNYFETRYPVLQKNNPVLWEPSAAGPFYEIASTSIPVTSFTGSTVKFAQPHGITDVTDKSPRFSMTGSSNGAFNNGRYYIYSIVDTYTVNVYLANAALNGTANMVGNGGTVTFGNGPTAPIVDLQSSAAGSNGMRTPVIWFTAASCPANEVGQTFTITGNSYSLFNGAWYLASSNGFTQTNQGQFCSFNTFPLPSGSGTGGTAALIADNDYHAGISQLLQPAVDSSTVSAGIMFAAEKGMAGTRVYNFQGDVDEDPTLNAIFSGDANSVQPGSNPLYNGTDAVARWQALSNAFNLIADIEPYLLQPKLNSPDYGPSMVTGARTSSYGKMLMMTNWQQTSDTETVNLAEYNPSGGTGTMYRMSATSLTQGTVSGLSTQLTFGPGETIVFTFPPSTAPVTPTIASFSASPASITAGASSTLSWSVSGATSLTINQGVGPQSSLTTGSVSVTPSATTTYTLTATNGSTSVTMPATVSVQAGSAGSPPALTSSQTASGTVGTPFSFQLTATNSPTSFTALGLPAGLSLNSVTGLISGTPTAAATSHVQVSASNSAGTSTSATLIITIAGSGTDGVPATPALTSAFTASGTVGTSFNFQITATNSPTSFSALGLPTGLSLNSATGLISGTPAAAGTSHVQVNASNAGGTSTSATLIITISAAGSGGTSTTPVLTSAYTASGTVGTAFYFQITATNSPTSFSALGLPSGLSLNSTSGLISGTPTTAGTPHVQVSASNSAGTSTSGTLIITISAAGSGGTSTTPVLTSAYTASGTVGTAFYFQITATNSPTSFSALGLPAGLSLNSTTGLISGTPTTAGTPHVQVNASNSAGTSTSATLIITISAATASTTTTAGPLVAISSPLPSSAVSSSATIAGSAQNDAVKVELYVDNVLAGAGGSWTSGGSMPSSNLAYAFTLDTTTLTNATHVLTMKAYDASGDVGVSSPVSITVSNWSNGGEEDPRVAVRKPVTRDSRRIASTGRARGVQPLPTARRPPNSPVPDSRQPTGLWPPMFGRRGSSRNVPGAAHRRSRVSR